jgi:peptide/nickel transport system ATP-binding protein
VGTGHDCGGWGHELGGVAVSEPVVVLREVFCVHRTGEGDAAALQGTNLELGTGELLCVLGPSGAGKSTLLRVIAGLQEPSAGVVQVFGRDIGRAPARLRARLRHRQIGFLGQRAESTLPPDLSAADTVGLPLALRGVGSRSRRARVRELLDAAALAERANALPDELSGGERQRVALCAALAHRPSLLLADEPTGELDDEGAAAIRQLIGELAHAHGTSVVVVSHDPAAAEIADRAVRIRDGRVVEDRRDGESALVVGRGGWLRLPSELLEQAGIGERAHAALLDGGVMLRPAGAAVAAQTPGAGRTDAPPAPSASAGRSAPAGSWTPARVQLREVSRGHGRGAGRREVIERLTVTFTPGRMTVVSGRSGAGKTTLLGLIGGLDRADHGEVLIDGSSLGGWDAEGLAELRRARIGYLPQEPTPVGFLSAEENVVLSLRLRGWDPSAAAERAAVALARVGLADRARQRVFRLSAGEAQRVALARALASARGLLIADEPTSRLDESNAARVAELLAEAAAADGQTVICATHDPELIGRADEVLRLERRYLQGNPLPRIEPQRAQ